MKLQLQLKLRSEKASRKVDYSNFGESSDVAGDTGERKGRSFISRFLRLSSGRGIPRGREMYEEREY